MSRPGIRTSTGSSVRRTRTSATTSGAGSTRSSVATTPRTRFSSAESDRRAAPCRGRHVRLVPEHDLPVAHLEDGGSHRAGTVTTVPGTLLEPEHGEDLRRTLL